MGWMECYGLFGAELPVAPRDPVKFVRVSLADNPGVLAAAAAQHDFEYKVSGMRRAMTAKADAELGALLLKAATMPCGILVATGTAVSDERVLMKTLVGFHPGVPAGEVQYIDGGVVDWNVLEKQIAEIGGEHGGAGTAGGVDGVRRRGADDRAPVGDPQAAGARGMGHVRAGEDAGGRPGADAGVVPAP